MSSLEFVYETYIRATAETIWEALTTPEFTARYFHATRVDSTWKKGDPVVYHYASGGAVAVDGKVLEAEPPRKLVISWHVLYDNDAIKEAPSRVSFRIESLDGQCRLRITHDRFPENSVVYDSIRSGWPWIISGLKSLLETGEPLPLAAS